jgi:hypothetical protein
VAEIGRYLSRKPPAPPQLECLPGQQLLLESRARELHHLGPLLCFLCEEPAEVGGRAHKAYTAKGSKPRLDLCIGKGRVDLLVEYIDDLGTRVVLACRSQGFTSSAGTCRQPRGRVVPEIFLEIEGSPSPPASRWHMQLDSSNLRRC